MLNSVLKAISVCLLVVTLFHICWYQEPQLITWKNSNCKSEKGFLSDNSPIMIENYGIASYDVVKNHSRFAMPSHSSASSTLSNVTHVVLLVCGAGRIRQSINLIKTTVLFASQPVKFTIFTEEQHLVKLSNQILSWPTKIREKFSVEFREPLYPMKYEKWRDFYAKCSTLRIFLPDLMNNTDSIIYIDVDCIVLSDISALWYKFMDFDSKQMFAAANETDVYVRKSWYQHNSVKFPFYGSFGFNAGVLLMNLTRMREQNFIDKTVLVYEEYQEVIVLADQDMLNILAYFNPEYVYSLDCSWNFRSTHCLRDFICAEASRTGPKLLHGNSGLFDPSNWLPFKDRGLDAIYSLFDQYNFVDSPKQLMLQLEQAILNAPNKYCSKHKKEFLLPFLIFRSKFVD